MKYLIKITLAAALLSTAALATSAAMAADGGIHKQTTVSTTPALASAAKKKGHLGRLDDLEAAVSGHNDRVTTIEAAMNDHNDRVTALDALHSTYAIGDTGPGGGYVFYIENGGKNGLEAARVDQEKSGEQSGKGAQWGCYQTVIAGANSTAIGTGAQNTYEILLGCSETEIAAKLADDYITFNYNVRYDDWFLPSVDELKALYDVYDDLRINTPEDPFVASFANDYYYWSSTDIDLHQGLFAKLQDFIDGRIHELGQRRGNHYGVRAVRAF